MLFSVISYKLAFFQPNIAEKKFAHMQDIESFLSQHILLTAFAVILLIFIIIVEIIRARKNKVAITPNQMTTLINHQNAVVLDIRHPEIYQKGHIINAVNFAAADLQAKNKKLDKYKNKPIVIVCGSGNESQKLAIQLLKQGYNTYVLSGGMRAWQEAQMPIVKE